MSVAVNMKGRKISDMRSSIIAHQIRKNEKDAKKILKDTDSEIDPELSHLNKVYFHDSNRFKSMRDKLDKISEKRQAAGGKKVYKSANVFMIGTLQISDDSLEALGWKFEDGKKLPADKQSKGAVKRVNQVYADMIRSVKSQPEIYGDIFSATLHMDEGSPHVDFLSDPLDVNEPDKLARHYLNGPKGTPKGHNLSVMQDNIMSKSRISENDIERYGLTRGDGTSSRMNTAREIRAEKKLLEEQKASLKEELKDGKSNLISIKDSVEVQLDELVAFRESLNRMIEKIHIPEVAKIVEDMFERHPLDQDDMVEFTLTEEDLKDLEDDGLKL